MAMNYQDSTPIVVGSGELYAGLCKNIKNLTALTTEESDALINIGAISEDAVVKVAKEFKEIESSNRGIIDKICTKTTVTFTAGVLTFILKNISTLLSGSEYSEDNDTRTMVIGAGDKSPDVYLRFIHTDKNTGKTLTVNIFKARFDGEIELAFGEDATVTNYNFTALSVTKGNKPVYVEFIEQDGETTTTQNITDPGNTNND